MRPALEYDSSIWLLLSTHSICSIWSHPASTTSIIKLQVMQDAALRTATGCTQDTNIHHLHDETLTLSIHEHLQLPVSQYQHNTPHPSHSLHKHTTYFNTPRLKMNHYLLQQPLQNKLSYRPHTITTTDVNKHAPYTYIYCL